MKRIVHVAVMILVMVLSTSAQTPRFQRLTTDDGLSDNAVNCVLRDRAGFLYIGTERGLDRYDGQRVDSVPGAAFAIAAITQDAQGVLWAATKNHGLLRVDNTMRSAQRIQHAHGSQLTAILDLNDTTLLLGSREHTLLFLDKRTHVLSYWADSTSIDPALARPSPTRLTGWCHAITPLNDRWLWIGLLNSHTSFIVDRADGRIIRHLILRRTGSQTQTCMVLTNGVLHSGGWQNGMDIIEWDAHEGSPRFWAPKPMTIPTSDEVSALALWNDSSILVGTRSHGLHRSDPRSRALTRIGHRGSDNGWLPSDRIRCLYTDEEGILWVGTANGLAFHAPQVWNMRVVPLSGSEADEIPELIFHRLEAEGRSGARVFTSNGFYVQATEHASVRHIPIRWNGTELQPTALLREGQGALIGTEYGLVRQRLLDSSPLEAAPVSDGQGYTYRPGDMYQVRRLSLDSLSGRPVLVVGTLGFGAHVLDARTMTLLGTGMPPAAHTVKARSLVADMHRDPDGRYWIASGDGLYTWNRNEPVTNGFNAEPQALSHAGILASGASIAGVQRINGVLWAIARDGRLLRVQGDSAMALPTPWKVAAMHGFIADQADRLWITTDDGLVRYDPADRSFLRVPVNDGGAFRKLTRAIALLNGGRVALAANNSLITFDPQAFDSLPPLPAAYLSSAMAGGRPVDVVNGQAELSYRAGVIDIGLSALAFGYPQPLEFDYRLEDVEPEWRSITARAIIRYAGIPVGEHRLLVRVKDPYGRIGPEQMLLTITVAGPFWQQWWFYAVAAMIISAIAFAWSRYRLLQALKLQSVRNRIASDLHDEVGSSLSSITIGSKLAAQLSTSDNAQVQAILARIGETSSESLRSIRDIVWAIDPKNDQGEALVKRMKRIAHELLEHKGVEVSFTVSVGVDELKLPMNMRKDLLLIFKEAVHNASKYAEARHVAIHLSRTEGSLSLLVEDDGKGFDPALHPDGHGLGSMRRRADSLGTSLELESRTGKGTRIGVRVDLTRIRD